MGSFYSEIKLSSTCLSDDQKRKINKRDYNELLCSFFLLLIKCFCFDGFIEITYQVLTSTEEEKNKTPIYIPKSQWKISRLVIIPHRFSLCAKYLELYLYIVA